MVATCVLMISTPEHREEAIALIERNGEWHIFYPWIWCRM